MTDLPPQPVRAEHAALAAAVQALRQRAAALAEPLRAAAAATTSVACERGLLRLYGVGGLDRAGRPLALEVTERLVALRPERLGGGVSLPFAAAANEYDLEPQELALEVADGHVDLGLEAELLHDPQQRAAAERTVGRWVHGARQRFEASRTARAEMRQAFGDPPLVTRVAMELRGLTAGEAIERAAGLIADGADAIWVPVPRDRELRRGLDEAFDPPDATADPRVAPAGSQRGLALLRVRLDEATAQEGRYIRLASSSRGLAAPDQAVVAGLERVDLVACDPLESIVEFGVEPARAFTDHLFALGLHAQSGVQLVLGPGPLAIAPELGRGEPGDATRRAGRALALQALGVAFSLAGGFPAERLLVGALPAIGRGAEAAGQGLAEVALRRLVFPGHGLVVVEPVVPAPGEVWAASLQAWLCGGAAPAAVLRTGPLRGFGAAVREVRAAVAAAELLEANRELGALRGPALMEAGRMLEAALATLHALEVEGWDWLLGRGSSGGPDAPRAAAWIDAAPPVARQGDFDPLARPPVLG